MNPLYFIPKQLSAAWNEVTRPLCPEAPENEYFYTELFNFYHSIKGKTIDISSGESLFPIIIDNAHSINGEYLRITKVQSQKLSEVLALTGSR
ncbi:MAG: hypothetical protein QX199_00925 [Methylococcaceae bacterium]